MSTSDFYNIDYSAHYFIPLEEIEVELPCFGFMISNPNHMALVECIICEGMYGKVQAVPVGYEDGIRQYSPEKFYACDFDSLLRQGIIIKKESENQHVEIVNEWEPLTNNTYLVHSSYVVAD